MAWSRCASDDAILQRDTEGDRAKAISLLGESLALSS